MLLDFKQKAIIPYFVKACETSTNIAEQYFPTFKAKVILFVILWICSIVAMNLIVCYESQN